MSHNANRGSDTGAAFMGLILGSAFIGAILYGIVLLTNQQFEKSGQGAPAAAAGTTH